MAVALRLTPSDRLIAGYNTLLAVIWGLNWSKAAAAPWIALAHAAAACLPLMIVRAPRRRWGLMAAVREMYPLIMLAAFWPEVGLFTNVMQRTGFDAAIAALDVRILGRAWHAVWLPSMDWVWLSESMFFMYYGYYALIFLPPLIFAFRGHRPALRDLTFRLMTGYLVCYVFYLAFPVYGPRILSQPHPGPHTEGLFYQLAQATLAVGSSDGATFPSSHVVGAVTIALLGWRWFPRWAAVLLSIEALGVSLATVYTQQHYAIDSVLGVALGFTIQLAVVPVLWSRLSGHPRAGPVPVLPDFTRFFARVRQVGGSG